MKWILLYTTVALVNHSRKKFDSMYYVLNCIDVDPKEILRNMYVFVNRVVIINEINCINRILKGTF